MKLTYNQAVMLYKIKRATRYTAGTISTLSLLLMIALEPTNSAAMLLYGTIILLDMIIILILAISHEERKSNGMKIKKI